MAEGEHPTLVEDGLQAIGVAYGEDVEAVVRETLAAALAGEAQLQPIAGAHGDEALAAVRRVLEAGQDGWAWDALGRRPDSRPVKDLAATIRCRKCGQNPAPLIATDDGWECYNCGEPDGGE